MADYASVNWINSWLAEREKVSPAEACRAYCMGHPAVVAEMTKLRKEIEALRAAPRFTAEQLGRIWDLAFVGADSEIREAADRIAAAQGDPRG